jgi:hypothetical protein
MGFIGEEAGEAVLFVPAMVVDVPESSEEDEVREMYFG